MPWGTVKLNDGTVIPQIGFGTWHAGSGQQPTDQVEQALSVGFDHIDTAQMYTNEAETGQALRESGIPRSEIFITTKFSGYKDVETSIEDSLKFLGVNYVDLYLIHHPGVTKGDIPGLWKKFEKIYAKGYAKSIGVSNFNAAELELLLRDAKVKPVINQIEYHPYIQAQQLSTVKFCREHDIAVEAYSPLIPVTELTRGALNKPLARIAERTGATHDQILLAWNKAKGNVVLTASSKKWRLEGYLKAGDLELTPEEIRDLDIAGDMGPIRGLWAVTGRLAVAAAAAGALWITSHVLGLGF